MAELLDNAAVNEQDEPSNDLPVPSKYMQALSKHRLLTVQECDKDGATSGPVVYALLVDGDLSLESQWQSPFENSNPENKLPSLMAGLQSGTLQEFIGNVANIMAGDKAKEWANRLGLSGLEGKTNFTKVNSTQVYVSSGPVRISFNLEFLAYQNAELEVEKPLNQLQKWVMAKKLAKSLTAPDGGLFPSEIPPFVAINFAGKAYKPLIIESISAPIAGPMDINGNRLSVAVNMSVISRTSLDQNDLHSDGFYS